jgi:hypothetical protein
MSVPSIVLDFCSRKLSNQIKLHTLQASIELFWDQRLGAFSIEEAVLQIQRACVKP